MKTLIGCLCISCVLYNCCLFLNFNVATYLAGCVLYALWLWLVYGTKYRTLFEFERNKKLAICKLLYQTAMPKHPLHRCVPVQSDIATETLQKAWLFNWSKTYKWKEQVKRVSINGFVSRRLNTCTIILLHKHVYTVQYTNVVCIHFGCFSKKIASTSLQPPDSIQ